MLRLYGIPICVVASVVTFVSPVRSQNSVAGSSVLIVLEIAHERDKVEREGRFVEELGLALDGISVLAVRPMEENFVDLGLEDQIGLVRSLVRQHDAVAVTWLNTTSDNQLLLHMVAVSSGRALVRVVEITPSDGFERDLAMAAHELLGTAFLFHDLPDDGGTPIGKVVDSVRGAVALRAGDSVESEPTPPEEPDASGKGWMLGARLRTEGGLYGDTGPSQLLGGDLLLDGGITGAFRFRAFLGFLSGFLDGRSAAGVHTFQLVPGLGTLYLWDLGVVSLGPALELQLVWSNVRSEIERGKDQRFSHFWFKLVLDLEVHFHLTEAIALLFGGGVGLTPESERFTRESTGETVLATPFLSWELRVGTVFRL